MSHLDENTSDDEIFFGKLSLKELRKHLMTEQSYGNSGASKTWMSISQDEVKLETDCNTSIHIIETHSQPNLRPVVTSPKYSSVPGSPVLEHRKSDESFIQMENMVSKFCLSPTKEKDLELNNTTEIIEYILNNGPEQKYSKTNTGQNVKNEKICSPSPLQINSKHDSHTTSKQISPQRIVEKTSIKESPKYFTPLKNAKKLHVDVFDTPSSALTPTFKTPAYSISKKSSSSRITPFKTKAYQHISSPVACYIKNCPQVPLVQDVHPKKPLPGTSSIPRLAMNPLHGRIQNKENMNLPSIAYKSAKKIKVINQPIEKKLPQSQWVKKMTCSQPTVMRHANREINVKKPLMDQQEDSFANLSCLQAEVSICTQETAYKNDKH